MWNFFYSPTTTTSSLLPLSRRLAHIIARSRTVACSIYVSVSNCGHAAPLTHHPAATVHTRDVAVHVSGAQRPAQWPPTPSFPRARTLASSPSRYSTPAPDSFTSNPNATPRSVCDRSLLAWGARGADGIPTASIYSADGAAAPPATPDHPRRSISDGRPPTTPAPSSRATPFPPTPCPRCHAPARAVAAPNPFTAYHLAMQFAARTTLNLPPSSTTSAPENCVNITKSPLAICIGATPPVDVIPPGPTASTSPCGAASSSPTASAMPEDVEQQVAEGTEPVDGARDAALEDAQNRLLGQELVRGATVVHLLTRKVTQQDEVVLLDLGKGEDGGRGCKGASPGAGREAKSVGKWGRGVGRSGCMLRKRAAEHPTCAHRTHGVWVHR
eukprot:scaffold9940_cov104-Isochrysis_galbana.AAC.1